MFFRLCCCCFGGNQSTGTAISLLKTGNPQQCYTVHKVANSGKHGNDDSDSAGSNTGKNNVTLSQNSAVWKNKPVLIQPGTDNELTLSEYEEHAHSLHVSPGVKKKGRWNKALSKTKPISVKKDTQEFSSLANVSMMLLPTIKVANSSSSPSSLMAIDGENTVDDGRQRKIVKNNNTLLTAENHRGDGLWFKSQSMLNMSYVPEDGENNNVVDQNNLLALKYGLDTTLYRSTGQLSRSTEAVNKAWKSMEDFTSESGFVDLPMGTIHFVASYHRSNYKLQIRICKIEGLAPKGEDRLKYNCILKLAVLPNEKHAKCSRVISAHSTLNIDERFSFTIKNVLTKVLRISVYPAAYQGKYDAIGHSLFYVEDALSNSQDPRVMKLYKQSMPDIHAGSLQLTLKYNKPSQILNIVVSQGHNLPSYSGKCKTYIKLTQYHFGKKVRTYYSSSVSAKTEVKYNYNAELKIESTTIANTYIVINAKVKGFIKKDDVIGRVILGPYLYGEYGQKLTPWGSVFLKDELISYTFRMYL